MRQNQFSSLACLQELWLTAELDHVKGQQSVKNKLSLSLTVSYVLQDAFFLVPVGVFLPVPFHYVHLLAHSKIHLL